MPDIFSVSVRSPGGETIPAIRLGIQDVITYSFIYERTKITIAGELVEPDSGEELIKMRIVNPTPGIWSFEVVASGEIHNGNFHMWLPITEFLNTEVYFLTPSPYITLTEPALASSVISVSTYNGNNNSFYINSAGAFPGRELSDRIFRRRGSIFQRPGEARPGAVWQRRLPPALWRSLCSGRLWSRIMWLWKAGKSRIILQEALPAALMPPTLTGSGVTAD